MKSLSIQNSGFLGALVTTVVLPTPTFEDNFASSTGWTFSTGASYDSGNTEIDFVSPNGNSQALSATRTFGFTANNTAWVMRCKIRIDTLNFSGDQAVWYFGLADLATGAASNQDSILLTFIFSSALTKRLDIKDTLAARPDSTPGDTNFTTALAVNTRTYELRRTSSTTYAAAIYENEDDTTVIEEITGTVNSGTDGLDNFNLEVDTRSSSATDFDGSLERIRIWDGITSL